MSKQKTTTKIVPSVKNGKIELFRFICAIIIAIYHFNFSIEYKSEKFTKGYLAVEFFFIVTGYLMAKSLSKYTDDPDNKFDLFDTSLKYVAKKISSFYCFYIAAIIITSAAWIPYFKLPVKEYFFKLFDAVPTFLLLQMVGFKTADWYVPIWYLSAMVIVTIILTPILLKFPKSYSLYIGPFISVVLLGFIYVKVGYYNRSIIIKGNPPYGLMRAFAEISIGCTCFYLEKCGYLKKLREKSASVIAIICYILSFVYMYNNYKNDHEFLSIILITVASIITFHNKNTFTFLNNRFVYFLGKLSLPIFLVHSVSRYTIPKWIPQFSHYSLYMMLYLVATIILSIVCYYMGLGIKKGFTLLSKAK